MQSKTLNRLSPEWVCEKFKTEFKTASISNKLDSIIHSEQYPRAKNGREIRSLIGLFRIDELFI